MGVIKIWLAESRWGQTWYTTCVWSYLLHTYIYVTQTYKLDFIIKATIDENEHYEHQQLSCL